MNWFTRKLQAALDRKLAEIRRDVELLKLCSEVPFPRRELEPIVERLGFDGARVACDVARFLNISPSEAACELGGFCAGWAVAMRGPR